MSSAIKDCGGVARPVDIAIKVPQLVFSGMLSRNWLWRDFASSEQK